jgi:hypothetical protein
VTLAVSPFDMTTVRPTSPASQCLPVSILICGCRHAKTRSEASFQDSVISNLQPAVPFLKLCRGSLSNQRSIYYDILRLEADLEMLQHVHES